MKLRALWTLKREAKSAFTFVSERGAPLHLALAGTGIASAAIELHRRQLASPARCGRLLAQTNPARALQLVRSLLAAA
jgi:hypothetical protein